MTFVWNGALDPSLLADDVVSAGHRLADAAKVGNWKTVFEMLDDPSEQVDVNSWRPGGSAWFTVLHQAAWHGAPTEVVGRLIRRGALRSQTDSRGRTPRAVRRDRQREMSLAKGAAVQNWEPPVLPAGAPAGTALTAVIERCGSAQRTSRGCHRQPDPRGSVRRARSAHGSALPARRDSPRGARKARVVPGTGDVRRLRHHAAA